MRGVARVVRQCGEGWPFQDHAPISGGGSRVGGECTGEGLASRPSIMFIKNCYIKNVALFQDNSILLLPECLESSDWQFLRVEVSQ